MGKGLAKRAAGEVVKGGSLAGWIVIIITAVGIVLAWNPYGHGHHWTLVLIIAIVGIILAAICDKTMGKRVR